MRMTKMSLGESKKQASSCEKGCKQLNEELSSLTSTVNQLNSASELQGAAARSAKSFASATVIPYLNKAQSFLDAISISVNNFTKGYESEVDTKSWSEEELEEKINKFNEEMSVNSGLLTALAAISEKGKVDFVKSAADKIEKNNESLQKCKNYYQKILDDFRKFDKSSSKYFDGLSDFSSALNKGKRCIVTGYAGFTPGGNSYKQYSPQDLNWENEGTVPKPVEGKIKHSKAPKGPQMPSWDEWLAAAHAPLKAASDYFKKKEKKYSKHADNLKHKVYKYSTQKKQGLYRRAKQELSDTLDKAEKSKVAKSFMKGGDQIAKAAGVISYIKDYKERKKKGESTLEAGGRTAISWTFNKAADVAPDVGRAIGVAVVIDNNPELVGKAEEVGETVGVGASLGIQWVDDHVVDSDIQD